MTAIEIPRLVRRPEIPDKPRDGAPHFAVGYAWVSEADGSIAWEDDAWVWNAVVDEGEADVLNTWLRGVAITSKYLVLIEGGTTAPVETDTMAYLGGGAGAKETRVPAVDGYNRQQVLTTDWNAPALNSGDMQADMAASKVFGPASGSNWTGITHAGLVTAATGQLAGSGKFLEFLALAGTTAVNIGQSFNYLLKLKVS